MRSIITGGGTGGHVYPALAVADALLEEGMATPSSLLYVGGAEGPEAELVKRRRLPFASIEAGALRDASPWKTVENARHTASGLLQAYGIMGRFRPQVTLATGGYVSVPVALASRMRGVPFLIYLPDIRPGWAVSALARLAAGIAVTNVESSRYLPNVEVVETGYPVRPSLGTTDRAQACRTLGIDVALKTLMVFGGSRGAHSINEAVEAILLPLLEMGQVVHISGREDYDHLKAAAARLPQAAQSRYHLFDYLHEEMPAALTAAHLALCRAGASTLGEMPAVGLPAILVPYPHAGAHQVENARILVQAGAAVTVADTELDRLLPLISGLLGDEALLERMGRAARRLARPGAASAIAHLLQDIALEDDEVECCA